MCTSACMHTCKTWIHQLTHTLSRQPPTSSKHTSSHSLPRRTRQTSLSAHRQSLRGPSCQTVPRTTHCLSRLLPQHALLQSSYEQSHSRNHLKPIAEESPCPVPTQSKIAKLLHIPQEKSAGRGRRQPPSSPSRFQLWSPRSHLERMIYACTNEKKTKTLAIWLGCCILTKMTSLRHKMMSWSDCISCERTLKSGDSMTKGFLSREFFRLLWAIVWRDSDYTSSLCLRPKVSCFCSNPG